MKTGYHTNMITIAFTGGGTAGHIYPGLAVAQELKNRLKGRDLRIFWIGSNVGMDRKLVEEAGIEFFGIPSGKLRRYFSLKTVPDFFRVIAGFFAAVKILKKEKARLLFSKGGYVSVPPCAAAAAVGIRVFTHESDYSPGLATKINARFARKTAGKIFCAYKDTLSFLNAADKRIALACGNPVRSQFRGADSGKGLEFLKLPPGRRILLVLGGSQGAAQINNLVRETIASLTRHYTVVHQHGAGNPQEIPASEHYRPYPFIGAEMPHVLAAAELVLGRSGAGTIWECAALGKPMLLVPLSGAGTRGDQVENARFFQAAGAALVMTGDGVTAQALAENIQNLAEDAEKRAAMATASDKIGREDAAAFIAGEIEAEFAEKFANGQEGEK